MSVPTSTYRLQVRASFDLHAAADACDYLATLGAGAVYLSPLLPSTKGSDHGYDVIAFDTVDPQRGGQDGWTRLLAAARARHMKLVVDIVPNHTGVEDPTQNAAWWDLLAHGREAGHASWFDVDWTRGRVLLPVLGDDFDPSQLEVDGDQLTYFEHRFPIAPGTGPGPHETAADVHDRQHYELVNFRRADTDQNYRRFFAVTTLAGLRVEDRRVFDATHAEIARWVHEGGVDGLRVDHPDGLTDPVGYLRWLRELVGRDTWIVVEKILEHGEVLPPGWPVAGTTGYDALTEVTGVFVDPSAEGVLDAAYRSLTGDDRTGPEHVREGKRFVVDTILAAELSRLARLAPDVAGAREALVELVVAFGVYRSYQPDGGGHLDAAVAVAQQERPDLAAAVDALLPRLQDPADELCSRFQQTTGAVMAKGVEDTAFYRYSRFVALNEVGNDPTYFGSTVTDFHAAQQHRQQTVPNGMTTLSTHDTKRGEDVRARLAVLSELPQEWTSLAGRLMDLVPLPDRPFGYLMWQTIAGVGFVERDRLHAYAEKAMREAAVSTGWIDPVETFERQVHALVDAAYDRPDVHDPLGAFVERITPFGWSNALGQKLVQLTMPGAPDVYQGSELWEDSLVDPDNRRAVDFAQRRAMLDGLDADGLPPEVDASGTAKLWLVSRTLRLRRESPGLFAGYKPVDAAGAATDHLVGYDRGGVVVLATRRPVGLGRDGGWRGTTLQLNASCHDVLSGRSFEGSVELADVLSVYPVALLRKD